MVDERVGSLAPGSGTQRSASSPLAASTSTHLLSPSDHLPPSHPHQHEPGQPPLRSSGRPPRPKPRQRRSLSAPTPHAATLSSSLVPHSFTVDPSPIDALPFETKHEGPASLKRIFIGPHLIGSHSNDKGKRREDAPPALTDDSGSSSSDSDSGDDDLAGIDSQGRTARMRRRLDRRQQRKLKAGAGGVRKMSVGSAVTQPGSGPKGGSGGGRWTGGTFEIGGDVREAARRREEAAKRREASTRALAATMTTHTAPTFTTANTSVPPPSSSSKPRPKGTYTLNEPPTDISDALPELTHALLRRSSDPLSDSVSLSAPHPTPPSPSSDPTSPPTPSRGILRTNSSTLGMGFPSSSGRPTTAKTVQLPQTNEEEPGPGDRPPAPVEAVLSRPTPTPGEQLVDDDILAAAAAAAAKRPRAKDGILRKERMLVRAEWTEREDVPDSLDVTSARKIRTTPQPWEEYAVVWRSHHLELWTAHTFSASRLFTGHPKLKHLIPLTPSHTHLSLYSSPDLIFSLTHRPTPSSLTSSAHPSSSSGTRSKASKRAYVHFRHAGTNIYTFRTKSNPVAKAWMWELHLALGGMVPTRLDIKVPGLGARISLPVPVDLPPPKNGSGSAGYVGTGEGEGWRMLTPEAVVKACVSQLATVPDWKELVERCERDGVEFRLAWRRGEILEWVEMGKKARDWSVVVGWILRQPNLDVALELRPALHYPTTVHQPSTPTSPSTRLSEPPGIEGYLTRHKPSNTSERIYLTTHDGHLFLSRPSTAEPPDPPLPVYESVNNPAALVLAPFVLGFASMGAPQKKDKLWERMIGKGQKRVKRKEKEERRKWERKKSAAGGGTSGSESESEEEEEDDDDKPGTAKDVLRILERDEAARAVKQIVAARGFVDLRDIEGIERLKSKDGTPIEVGDELEDVGGEEGLARVGVDKDAMRRARTFTLRTKSGVSVNFECYSIAFATEWVGRLNALATYWSRRERIDAIEQMELQPNSLSSPRLSRYHGQPHGRPLSSSSSPPDPAGALDLASPLLARVYNHCILDGCRSIVRSGRFYVKHGVRGMFKERYIFLLKGVILHFEMRARDVHGVPTKTPYHRRKASQNLRGCYVYSGRLSTSPLAAGVATGWKPGDGQSTFPRIYASDGLRTSDEDEDCTLIVFKKTADGPNQGLGTKGKVTVFRARSMIERDEWVFALNVAIKNLQDGDDRERERRLKEFAWLKTVPR